MKNSYLLILLLVFVFKFSSNAQNNTSTSTAPSDAPTGYTYNFDKVQSAIINELLQPSKHNQEAKQLINTATFPKLKSTVVDENYKQQLKLWIEANSTLVINTFKNNKTIVTPY